MRYLILRDIVNTLRCYTESILFTCKAVCKGGFVNNSIISEIILSTDRNFNARMPTSTFYGCIIKCLLKGTS